MTHVMVKRSIWVGIGIALVASIIWLLRPPPLHVEAGTVTRGPLRAMVTDEGRTRVKALYTVTAPVDGELERVALEPGAELSPQTVIAQIWPIASRPLDARSRAEATAAVAAARQAVARADAAEREAKIAVEHAESKLTRTQNLAEAGAAPRADLEHAGHEVRMAKESLEDARAAARQARADLARATAIIAPAPAAGTAPPIEVRAPAHGLLLRVVRESAGPVATGAPLVEIGDVTQLEIVVDLLSSDAASVRSGALATVSGWGGGEPLSARVRRVDPAGFTKVSALGLEEQRVRVVLDLTDPPPRGLGHDYRVDVGIVVWEDDDALRVPSTALFRVDDHWSVFVIRDGRARLANVETGPSDATSTIVTKGLAAGEKVIPQPSDVISDGMRIVILREVKP